jgi:cob(I)alamin adenosyltransferase
MNQGFVQVYTGDGKGKTTAAIGLAVRAAGHGIAVHVGQFMKGTAYGEVTELSGHPRITIEQYGSEHCLRREEVTAEDRARAADGLRRSREAMLSGRYGLIVLDEINVAVWFGLLPERAVLAFLEQRPAEVEVVLTGRRAPEAFVRVADLVTEFRQIKHYYERGILARDGIER